MRVSFIILTYQRAAALQNCLDSVYRQRGLPPYEIILIDNGGSAQPSPPPPHIPLHIERPPQNLGVAAGRNRGLALARGAYCIFIDDDAVWVGDDAAARLVQVLDENPHCAAVAVKSLHPTSRAIIRQDLPHPNKDFLAQAATLTPTPYFYGVAHALRRAAVQQVGAYPPRYGYAMEEIDLAYRLQDAGYAVLYAPNVAVYHHYAPSGRPYPYVYQNALNKARFALRLLPLPYPFGVLLVWSAWAGFKTRRLGVVWAIWRALWAERATLWGERRPIRRATLRHIRHIGGRSWF